MLTITQRLIDASAAAALSAQGVHPLLARVYAARGIANPAQLDTTLARLHAPQAMLNLERMAALIADAIAAREKLLIIADYDADGATACAVGLRAMRAMGATIDYLVPNRFEYGYGLTPQIVQLAAREIAPAVIITVDNGIASVEGVAEANRLGIKVLITDHHLPGEALPDAWCIINPNQRGCGFPSKHLAGVGVMFYLMMALRAELRQRHNTSRLTPHASPNLATLLDLVALGTVADVVRLDDNNRILVQQGLQRIRAGRAQPGISALLRVAGRDPARAGTYDLGFAAGPRLNAAGRLTDMSLGIECLITDDAARAQAIAHELDALNRERRAIEADMQETALAALEQSADASGYTLSLYDDQWHQGVIGIVASRLKDKFHRPAVAFARGNDGEIKGSGRSIRGLHLRDALDLVSKRAPGLILRFGGHAAAAGLTLREPDFARFRDAFEAVVRTLLRPADLEREIETDGSLPLEHATLEAAHALRGGIWGQGFPEPGFTDTFEVAQQRVVGERHLKLRLRREGCVFDGILFGHCNPLPARIRAVYRFSANEYNGVSSTQLVLDHWETP
ncbi:MAG: single-stranded-DNA-specific exonuclease RecJ [Betaproteobacteria bacterium]|nr:single-stranded-DNA-specific exonuclease RecJ [Betaproteobacteria bacterium]